MGLVLVACVGMQPDVASAWQAEAVRSETTRHRNLIIDRDTAATEDDYNVFSFSGADGVRFLGRQALGLGTNPLGGNTAFAHQSMAPVGSFSLTPNGVGVGLSGFDLSPSNNAQAALHVVGGGVGGPFQTQPAFPNGQMIVEDRNDDGA